MDRNLSPQIEILRASGAVAGGTGDTLDFTEVDLRGYQGAIVVVALGAVAAGATATLDAKLSDVSGSYGAGTIGNVAGAQAPVASGVVASNRYLVLEIHRPRRRFLRPRLVRAGGANVAIEQVFVILHEAGHVPTPGVQLAAAERVILNNPIPAVA